MNFFALLVFLVNKRNKATQVGEVAKWTDEMLQHSAPRELSTWWWAHNYIE